jgi:single-stranded DNA-binding protein
MRLKPQIYLEGKIKTRFYDNKNGSKNALPKL